MGLAASQCRLLLLTARLHDTEYRAQMISQRRMALAMQTEQIATEYARKLSNRTLRFVYDLNSKDNSTMKEPLTYKGLTAMNSHLVGQYRVTLPDGRVAVPSLNDIPGTIMATRKDDDGNTYYTEITQKQIVSALQAYVDSTAGSGKDTSDIKAMLADSSIWDASTLQKAYDALKDAGVSVGYPEQKLTDDTVFKSADGETEYVVMPALNNMEFFQNALKTGQLSVEKYNDEVASDNWESYDLLNSQFVQDDLYTEDDALASAEYQSKSAMIQSQDKQLELELKQVETQHQAAQTEYDSVKKVIDKNIERSFKTFG